MKIIAKALPLMLAIFCFTAAVSAATFNVNTTVDTAEANPGDGVCADSGGACSFRAAITEANALAGSDTIVLPAGTYTQTLPGANDDDNAGGDWDIRSNIAISGAAATILQASAAFDTATERVLHSVFPGNSVTIGGVTIRHGKKSGGASDTTRGAGIFNAGGDLTLNDSIVTLNRASGGGGIYNFTGNITINNSTISGNRCEDASVAFCYGGGIYNSFAATKNITITGSTFTGNTAKGTDSFMASGFGGGLGVETSSGAGANLNISNSSFTNNLCAGTGHDPGVGGGAGAGIHFRPQGASVINISDTSVSDNDITGGNGHVGTGISISSTGNLTGTWDKVTVANNEANYTGLGAFIGAFGNSTLALDIKNSAFFNNKPNFGTSAVGGGVAVQTANTANAAVNFLNTTISGNSAGVGGGISIGKFESSNLTVNLNFCTIAGNAVLDMFSGSGGGLANAPTAVPATVNLKNTVIADNSAVNGSGPDFQGTFNSQDYNHIENLSGGIFTPQFYDTSGFDPQLGALQNNGGPTLTHLPAATSPLLDTIPFGQNGCGNTVFTDQRIFGRPFNGNCDKGAVERGALAAGPWSLSGVVKTTSGAPIRNAAVTISGGNLPAPITVVTGTFGTYQFTNLIGNEYTVDVSIKRYHFNQASQVFALGSNITNADFVANSPLGRESSISRSR